MESLKVRQFEGNNGAVKNQFLVWKGNDVYFQSYDSMIAKRTAEGEVSLDERYWNYSKTTSKYRNQFLGEPKKVTEAKIKSGEYKLVNLNA